MLTEVMGNHQKYLPPEVREDIKIAISRLQNAQFKLSR